jgi:hypothetical protein
MDGITNGIITVLTRIVGTKRNRGEMHLYTSLLCLREKMSIRDGKS